MPQLGYARVVPSDHQRVDASRTGREYAARGTSKALSSHSVRCHDPGTPASCRAGDPFLVMSDHHVSQAAGRMRSAGRDSPFRFQTPARWSVASQYSA